MIALVFSTRDLSSALRRRNHIKDTEGKKATMHDLYAHDDFWCVCRVSGFERDLFLI